MRGMCVENGRVRVTLSERNLSNLPNSARLETDLEHSADFDCCYNDVGGRWAQCTHY